MADSAGARQDRIVRGAPREEDDITVASMPVARHAAVWRAGVLLLLLTGCAQEPPAPIIALRAAELVGAPASPQTVTLPLAKRIASAAGRHQFYTVRVEEGTAVPAFKASGDITSMSRADGYIEIPADVDVVEAGTPVVVTLF